MPKKLRLEVTLAELTTITTALNRYGCWLGMALEETHRDLKALSRRKRHDERVECEMLRGRLYKQIEQKVED